MDQPERDEPVVNEWPLCATHRERLEYASERVYDAREVLRKVLAGEPMKKDEVANAALDLNGVMLILREMGVAVPFPVAERSR